jgi:3-methyladenine DNA glycosylase/8-oxoguanine DNA glycosylase
MPTLTLPAKPPFSFRSVIYSHGWMQLAPFAYDEAAASLSWVDRLPSGRVLEVRAREAPGGIALETIGRLIKAEQSGLEARASWMFGLDMDFSEFYARARKEPKLAGAEKSARGRILRSPAFFEDVVKTILTTNTLWGATKRMTANLVTQFGEPLPSDPDKHAFPTPARLAAAAEAQLRTETRLGYRAPYILELAVRTAAGDLDLEALRTSDLPTPELRKELMGIKGVGGYAAANLLMILGRYDYLTVDSWARKMVSQEWYGGGPVDTPEVEAHFEKWGKWKGLAYWFWEWSNPS